MTKSTRNNRQPRNPGDYSRRPPRKELQKSFLLICEGQTEKIYFELLKIAYRLQSVVIIKCAKGGATKVVDLAKSEITNFQAAKDAKIWCVFDTEASDNSEFVSALREAKKAPLSLAISNPCIEYWFLLHYEYSTSSLANCDSVCLALSKWISNYAKNQNRLSVLLSEKILPNTSKAIETAENCLKDVQLTCSDEYPNPSTRIFLLVAELLEINRNKPYNS
jgi:hypothetical protein